MLSVATWEFNHNQVRRNTLVEVLCFCGGRKLLLNPLKTKGKKV